MCVEKQYVEELPFQEFCVCKQSQFEAILLKTVREDDIRTMIIEEDNTSYKSLYLQNTFTKGCDQCNAQYNQDNAPISEHIFYD